VNNKEIFAIPGSTYTIDTDFVVRNSAGKVIKARKHYNQYVVSISINGKRSSYYIHSLLLMAISHTADVKIRRAKRETEFDPTNFTIKFL